MRPSAPTGSSGAPGKGNPKSAQPAKLPIVRSLHLGRGHLTVTDAVRKLHFAGVVTADQAAHGGGLSLQLGGKGSINGAPFQLAASGDPAPTKAVPPAKDASGTEIPTKGDQRSTKARSIT
jgi:hypothetical protein